MSKEFDAEGWKRGHGDDFRRLIEMARRKKAVKSDGEEGRTPDIGSSTSNGTGAGARPPEGGGGGGARGGIIDMTVDSGDDEGVAVPEEVEGPKIPSMDRSASQSQSFSVEDVAA